ncbi:winged helix-turn-helix transcriptional regulator [Sinomonas sp. R1AF57]|uniref:winged helix-turn-helix transcriptional regulator n=1 Tax=Sinomonas TaxID=596707 RepID=UPI000B613A38|nr:winged helix-turn-helix transcriptional regulator [Sinomonas sp. R1AF57]ASN52411.1 transcriptional regulator [Sinomonas sp. R1AF57]
MPVPSSHGAQQPLGWRARLGALGSLGEERRRALYLFVRGAGRPVGRNEAADAVGLSRGTAAAHLDRLVDDGVLVATFAKPAGSGGPGSGRPSKFYEPAVQEVVAAVPQRSYELAGELLAAAAERSIADGEPMAACIAAVGRAAGETLGREHGSIGAVLEAAGYAPRSSADGGIDLSNCPFHRLSREYRGVVCSLNGALLDGALAGCGDGQHGIEPVDPDGPGHECCARVVPRP